MSAWPPPSALAERTTSPAQPTGSNNGARLPAQSTTETPALHSLFDAPPLQSGTAASLIGFAASSSSPSAHKAFPSTPNEGGTAPSLITSSLWSTGGIPSIAASKSNTYGSRQSPELSAFYGQTMSPESSHDQGTSGMGGGAGLAGAGSGANPSPRLYASSSLSRSQRHPVPPAELDDDGKLFHQRDEMLLPRRNHTIASGGVDYRRRLERQFQQQASRQAASPQQHPPNHVPSPVTSPTKNSLSAITGGEEEADSDWEAMIKRKESLIPTGAFDEDTREELDTAPWRPIPAASSSSVHRRFPSQPNTTFGTSPVDSTSSSLSGTGGTHQRSESAHANSGLNEGPFASSPIIPGSAFGSNAGLVRRHQSLNYHAGRQASNHLRQGRQEEQQQQRRSGLVSPALSMTQASESGGAAAPAIRSTAQQTQSSSSPAQSPIGTSPFPFSDRTPAFSGPHLQQRAVADDVSSGESGPSSYATQLSTSLMDVHAQLMRMSLNTAGGESQSGGSRNEAQSSISPDARLRKLPSLVTNRDELARGAASGAHHHGLPGVLDGPVSASAYVPPIGHGHHRNAPSGSGPNSFGQAVEGGDHRSYDLQKANAASLLRGPQSAFPVPFAGRRGNFDGASGRGDMQYNADRRGVEENGGAWHADSNAGAHHVAAAMNANRQYQPDIMRFGNPAPMMGDGSMFPEATLASQMAAMSHPAYWMSIDGNGAGPPFAQASSDAATAAAMAGQMPLGMSASIAMPAHLGGGEVPFDPAVSRLIQSKGYNPPLSLFNVNPPKARYFVIKSFTEDDVQRSLKHEIWASTEKGNQRLDRAFKESSGEGPLYLLFSVNASGHFCGIAEMLTPLDYSSDSNVWAQEGKWKGSFKVRWIYVKDVPNNRLRHIRLTNTPECKPITQSRDTQELPADGGRQALKIIAEFPSRTTLLQDWLFYEQKQPPAQEQEGASASRPQAQVSLAQDGDAKRPHTPEAASPPPRQHQTARSPLAPVAR